MMKDKVLSILEKTGFVVSGKAVDAERILNYAYTGFNNEFTDIQSELIVFLLNNGIDSKKIAQALLRMSTVSYIEDKLEERPELLAKKLNLLKLVFELAPNFDFSNLQFELKSEVLDLLLNNGLPAKNAVEAFGNLPLSRLNSNEFREYLEVLKKNNIDINISSSGDNDIFYEIDDAAEQKIEFFKTLVEYGYNKNINLLKYAVLIHSLEFDYVSKALEIFEVNYSKTEIYNIVRSYGISVTGSNLYADFHELLQDSKNNQLMEAGFSELEVCLLQGKGEKFDLDAIKNAVLTNKYGYSSMHLAIFSGNKELVKQMIAADFDLTVKNINNASPLDLLFRSPSNLSINGGSLLKKITNLDELVDNGESIADQLMGDTEIRDEVIRRTTDKLFSLTKNDADIFSVGLDESKTNIAISHDSASYWQTGIWSMARLIKNEHANVEFYLVDPKALEAGGDKFLSQFDAVINPGAGNSYPKGMQEFTINNTAFLMTIEKHYQNMLNKTNVLGIPYLGICAGAQHLALYHQGSLQPVEGYTMGNHTIEFIAGTLPYYMSLTSRQQNELISECAMPKVVLQGATTHHYAAVATKIGDGMQLGALSVGGVAMAYGHESGIRYATQFDPEHRYARNDDNAIYQKAWLDNFVKLAIQHHDHRVNGDAHPKEIFHNISARLEECLVAPTCIAESELSVYN